MSLSHPKCAGCAEFTLCTMSSDLKCPKELQAELDMLKEELYDMRTDFEGFKSSVKEGFKSKMYNMSCALKAALANQIEPTNLSCSMCYSPLVRSTIDVNKSMLCPACEGDLIKSEVKEH